MTHNDRHIIRLRKVDPTASEIASGSSQRESAHGQAPISASPEHVEAHMPRKLEIRKQRRMIDTKKAITLAVIAALLIFCLYLVAHSLWTGASPSDVTSEAERMTDTMALENVRQLMLVPDEMPAVAIVKDLIPLRDEQFFKNAQVGDFVLMFPQAGKAILYRPEGNRIIEVAPITSN